MRKVQPPQARGGRSERGACSSPAPPPSMSPSTPPSSSHSRRIGATSPPSAGRVMAVALEKQSEGNAQFALGSGRGASIGAGGAFAPYMRLYMHRTGAPADIGPTRNRAPSNVQIEPPPAATVWMRIIGAASRTPATSVTYARSYSPA